MLVNFERKVCYLAHPKTASQTTALTLREKSGFVPVTDHHHAWDMMYPGRDLEEMGLDPDATLRWRQHSGHAFVYLFVIRNPWDTLASWYELSKAHIRYEKIGPQWFEAWKKLNPGVFPPEDLWSYLEREPPGPVARLKYETLHLDLPAMAHLFRFPKPGELPWVGKTRNRNPDYRTYYDSESREWVEATFPKAIQAGSYTFE